MTPVAALVAALPGLRIELRRTRRSMVGLRRAADRSWVLRLHPSVLDDAACLAAVTAWARARGRDGTTAALREQLQRLHRHSAIIGAAVDQDRLAAMAVIGADADAALANLAVEVHSRWFIDLAPIPVTWSRQPPRRRLHGMRFGCYRRREASIGISPRLARPWIAVVFLRHVIHHEYCHHRLALRPPRPREGVHGPSFRSLERICDQLDEALHWERLALPWLLDDAPPPWWRP